MWRQILSDMLGISLRQMENSDSSFGSAMLAGVAAGVFPDFRTAAGICGKAAGFTRPNPDNTERYAALYPVYRQIHDALEPIYRQMG